VTKKPLIDQDMRDIIESTRLAFVATVSADGRPNLSPKASLTVWDETHLSFGDIASPNTIANLADNPAVEVNVVNFLARRGYRFKGTAAVFASGPVFDRVAKTMSEREGPEYPCRHGVLISVDTVAPLMSPAYTYVTGASEESLREAWKRRYGIADGPSTAEIDAYKEVVRVMLGFRTTAEMEDIFSRSLVWEAVKTLDKALDETRRRNQPDEFALAHAIENQLLDALDEEREHLEALFNDPNHHELPAERLDRRIAGLWDPSARERD
jgi:uncharacterized protein